MAAPKAYEGVQPKTVVLLDKCPVSIECDSRQRKVWQSPDGKLWRQDLNHGGFAPHVCYVRTSKLPDYLFVGEHYNSRTGRTRFTSAERQRTSAEKSPADGNFMKRGGDPAWSLVKVWMIEDIPWKEATQNEAEEDAS